MASIAPALEYLRSLQAFALAPGMINCFELERDRETILRGLQAHIDRLNRQLQQHLQACQDCFEARDRPEVQILAAPLSSYFGVDAFCNLTVRPITILLDVGRIPTTHWLGLVAHEYSHAQIGRSGHDRVFAETLSYLCLGLGLPSPLWQPGTEDCLRHYPNSPVIPDPLAFWRQLAIG